MQEIINLIWLTHPQQMDYVMKATEEHDQDSLDAELSTLMAALYVDDTFNEYSEEQLQQAVNEAINEV